jgi:arginase
MRRKEVVDFIGVPSSAGARTHGQEDGPKALRTTGLLEGLSNSGIDCRDLGNLPLVRYAPDSAHPKCQNLALVTAVARRLADRMRESIASNRKLLIIGGDCTLTLGVLAALTRRIVNPGLIYFDGDIDMNTPEETLSGILDGMGLAHMTGHVTNELSGIGLSRPLIREENIIAFGYNLQSGWIDAAEKVRFDQSSILKFPSNEIRGAIAKHAMTGRRRLEKKVESYIVHFDVDVVDESDFPAADVPHQSGLALDDVITALKIFCSSPQCSGLVVTEFNPNRDPDGRHAKRLTETLIEVMR